MKEIKNRKFIDLTGDEILDELINISKRVGAVEVASLSSMTPEDDRAEAKRLKIRVRRIRKHILTVRMGSW
ncbi:MAG: hypothetical protein Q7U36_00100 [bacterium]|nr:hypothetical protein [bacterium]